MSPCPKGDFVGSEIAGPRSTGLQLLRCLDLWCNRADNGPRHFLLYCEDVFQHAIIAFRPDVTASQRVDQQIGHADTFRRFADATLKHIPNAELSADLPDVR